MWLRILALGVILLTCRAAELSSQLQAPFLLTFTATPTCPSDLNVLVKTFSGTLYDLLGNQTVVLLEWKNYSFGNLLQCVAGCCPNSSVAYWEILKNGSPAQVGADELKAVPGDNFQIKYTLM